MTDRSDDIKQLFSHLGLNPGDYQEVRNPALLQKDASSSAGSSATSQPVPVTASRSMPLQPAEAAKPAQDPAPPTAAVAISPLATQPPGVRPGKEQADEVSRRWALLRAVQDNPPQVASIQAERRPPERLPPYVAPLPPQRTPAVLQQPVDDERPTQRLLQELREAPLDDTVERLSRAVRMQRSEPPAQAGAAAESVSSRPSPVAGVPPATTPACTVAALPTASGGLDTTFDRLLRAGQKTQRAGGRLRLNLRQQGLVPATAEPQPETLADVFQRLSQVRAAGPDKSGRSR